METQYKEPVEFDEFARLLLNAYALDIDNTLEWGMHTLVPSIVDDKVVSITIETESGNWVINREDNSPVYYDERSVCFDVVMLDIAPNMTIRELNVAIRILHPIAL